MNRRRPYAAIALVLAVFIPVPPGWSQEPAGAAVAPAADPVRDAILSNERVRVQRLGLEPGASTALHTHAHDHIAAALGVGEIADVAPDGAERRRTFSDGSLALVPAGVTHTLRNVGDAPFRAVTIDLLLPQAGARNRCGALLAGRPLDCAGKAAAASSKKKGGALVPQMETDRTLVSLLTLDPGAEHLFKASPTPPVVVALEGTDAMAIIEDKIPGAVGKGEKPLRGGDAATTLPKSALTIRNVGAALARFVVVEFED